MARTVAIGQQDFESIRETRYRSAGRANSPVISLRIFISVIPAHILNTCEPYIIRYPSPLLAARNSPIITPTRARPIFTFILLRIAGTEAGSTTFFRAAKRFPPEYRLVSAFPRGWT